MNKTSYILFGIGFFFVSCDPIYPITITNSTKDTVDISLNDIGFVKDLNSE